MRFALLLLTGVVCSAQAPKVVSPEVDEMRRVTFRLHAPDAKKVTLWGEWILGFSQAEELTRADDGNWTATIGPLRPGNYQYVFLLDGVAVLDPRNELRAAGQPHSLVEVPNTTPTLFSPRPVPHGEVHIHWQESSFGQHRVAVYVPPGYRENGGVRYPVLYLLHGSGGDAMDWIADGHLNVLLDNLIADEGATPMIVVMPQTNPLQSGNPAKDSAAFEEFLTHDVIPFAEDRYPILDGRKSRAVSGQSMGGFFALATWLQHPDRFASVGVFGAGAHGGEGRRQFEEFAADPERISNRPDVFLVAAGDKDMLMRDATQLDELLSEHQIEHRLLVGENHGHTWQFWRTAICEFLPLLFRDSASKTQ